MKTRSALLFKKHVVVSLALLALIAPTLAVLPSAARAGGPVPIHGQYETTIRLYTLLTGKVLDVVNGAGQASHLGMSFLHIEKIVQFLTDSLTFAGDFKMIAANGDILSGTIEGWGSLPGPDGSLPFWGTFTFTGGTGRFEGATGSADIIGLANVVTGQATYSFDGTVSLAGK